MKNGKPRKVYEAEVINNYRELLERVYSKYGNNIL